MNGNQIALLILFINYDRIFENYVYECFGGIGSLDRLYSGFMIQYEMTEGGLREQSGIPSVCCFYLAVFESLGDSREDRHVLFHVNILS